LKSIEVLYFEGCPSHHAAVELVHKTVDELGVDATVSTRDVETEAEATKIGFLGSPSIRVDGEDIEAGAAKSRMPGRRCRVYRNPNGSSGVPPADMLKAALKGETYEVGESSENAGDAGCCASGAKVDNTSNDETSEAEVQLLVADWCPMCPNAQNFWSTLRDERGFELEIIEIESEQGSALASKLGIRAVPATVIGGRVAFPGTPVPARDAALAALSDRDRPS